MTIGSNENTKPSAEEKQFIEHLAAHYGPEPMTPARRAAFCETLDARLEKRRRRGLVIPSLAAAAAVAALAWLFWPGLSDRSGETGERATLVVAQAASQDAWEYELLYPVEMSSANGNDESEMLPDDYQAIASLFLGP